MNSAPVKAADLDGRLKDLFGQGRSVQGDQDVLEVGLALQVGDALARPHQQHRHRQRPHQLVGHRAEPEAAERAAAVRGHHHQVGVDAFRLGADHVADLALRHAAA